MNVVYLLSSVSLIQLLNQCHGVEDACVYNSPPHGIIDFSKVGRKDGIPRWKNQVPDLPEDHGFVIFH